MDGKIELVPTAALAPIEAPTKAEELDGKVDEAVSGGTIKRAKRRLTSVKKQAGD